MMWQAQHCQSHRNAYGRFRVARPLLPHGADLVAVTTAVPSPYGLEPLPAHGRERGGRLSFVVAATGVLCRWALPSRALRCQSAGAGMGTPSRLLALQQP